MRRRNLALRRRVCVPGGTDHGNLGCLLSFLGLVAAAFVALILMGHATPGVMPGLLCGGFVVVVAAGSLVLFPADWPPSYAPVPAVTGYWGRVFHCECVPSIVTAVLQMTVLQMTPASRTAAAW
ncbi:hypothetical protein [Arthrobacter wenxiniae]|uniref:Uncharacterized protein n=1 Tax=Arthrobacter wenxiniae TaxID=2713570 RepID=A0A7Y7LZG5_9MICC|nr:hypothetical protein [Arthrobacter wenxiniae]NVM94631.1 hypothetical protein [Arthrobacter wenxiniae]